MVKGGQFSVKLNLFLTITYVIFSECHGFKNQLKGIHASYTNVGVGLTVLWV